MHRSSLRTWGAIAVLTSLALSACSTSDSSGIRTRNSATVDECILISPSTVTPEITARLARPDCGVALVDMTSLIGSRWLTVPLTSRNEQMNPTLTEMDITRPDQPYRFAFEARDSDNDPIHYVEVSNDDPQGTASSMVLKYSVPVQVSEAESCMKMRMDRGFNGYWVGADVDSCNIKNRVFLKQVDGTLVATNTDNPVITTTIMGDHLSQTIVDNGFPIARATVFVLGDGQFEYRYYRFSTPVEIRPFQPAVTATPQTTTPADSSTTLAPDTTTAGPDSTTTSIAAPSSSTSSTPLSIASQRSLDDACRELEGIEVFPSLDSWTTGTQFEISIANDCMRIKPDDGVNLVTSIVSAHNPETNENQTFFMAGDAASRLTTTGRLYAGSWNLQVIQYAKHIVNGELNMRSSFQEFTVQVGTDPASDWRPCTSDDISWDGYELVVDCAYTAGSAIPNVPLTRDWSGGKFHTLRSRGTGTPISMSSGWNNFYVILDFNEHRTVIETLMCASACDPLPARVDIDASTEDGVFNGRVTPDSCSSTDGILLTLGELRRSSPTLFVFNKPRSGNSYSAYVESTELSVPLMNGTDHVVVLEALAWSCADESDVSYHRWSILPLATAVSDAPSTAIDDESPDGRPARVDQVEFSRTDVIGAPVVLTDGQTTLLIPPTAIPEFFTSPESGITSIAVRAGSGMWMPVTRGVEAAITIPGGSTNVEFKLTFDDGTEAIVTKPIVESAGFVASDGKSSNVLVVLLVLLAMVVVAGGTIVLRRKS